MNKIVLLAALALGASLGLLAAEKPRVLVSTDIGDNFHGRFADADFAIVDNPWLDQNIRRKGALGAQHPHTTFLMEGEPPSFRNPSTASAMG